MPTSYQPYLPDQDFLLPHSMREWLAEGHLAYFVNDTVDSLDLTAFHARYAGGGSRNQPFHPAMMVKVLVYAYATGVFCSRKIERRRHLHDLGDLGSHVPLVHEAQGLVVEVGVHVSLGFQEGHGTVPPPRRPVVGGEHHL